MTLISRRGLAALMASGASGIAFGARAQTPSDPLGATPPPIPVARHGVSTFFESRMLGDLVATDAMRDVFDERRFVDQWIRTWVAMAQAQAEHGIVPKEASEKNYRCAQELPYRSRHHGSRCSQGRAWHRAGFGACAPARRQRACEFRSRGLYNAGNFGHGSGPTDQGSAGQRSATTLQSACLRLDSLSAHWDTSLSRPAFSCARKLTMCARVVQGRAEGLYSMLWQPNERHGGVCIAEWPLAAEHFLACSGALTHARELLTGLAVNVNQMRANLDLDGGAVMSAAYAKALSKPLGRTQAFELLKIAVARARKERRSLAEVIAEAPELGGKIAPDELKRLLDPANHVGLAPQLVDLAIKDAQRLWKS